MIISRICHWLLYSKMGWTKSVSEKHPDKYIICLAPHTSNWDFIIAQLYMRAERFHSNYLMKSTWFFWPLGPIFKSTGGIPVYRDKKNTHMTEALIEEAKKYSRFALTITPEGTRKANPNWKKGFYFIAEGARMPILVYALDYEKKQVICHHTFHPTGNVEEDLAEIKSYYKGIQGKYPDQFRIES